MRQAAAVAQATTAAADVGNGPQDSVLDWRNLDWRAAEDEVRRLRHRIFTASGAGDRKKVRSLDRIVQAACKIVLGLQSGLLVLAC